MLDTAFRHELLQHTGGTYGFVREALPHITGALAAGDRVLIAVSTERIQALRGALADDAERVRFGDRQELGSNPGRIIAAWRAFLEESCPQDSGALGIGEPIWPGRSARELEECHRHEALLNLAFDPGRAWRLLCPYDLDGLEDEVILQARENHPLLAQQPRASLNEDYVNGLGNVFAGTLPPPTGEVEELVFVEGDLRSLRGAVSRWGAEQGLEPGRAEELVLGVNELATNSILYGGGGGTLQMWREAEVLLCEVCDHGRIEDPLAGRIAPEFEQQSGRGLWIVNQVCDLVQIRCSREGTTIRVHTPSSTGPRNSVCC